MKSQPFNSFFNSDVHTKLPAILSHWCSTIVSLETYPLYSFDWFIGWLTHWLSDWQMDRWMGRWTGWLTTKVISISDFKPTWTMTQFLFIYWIFTKIKIQFLDWLIDWQTEGLTGWLTDWLTDWLVYWLAGWLTDWLTDWLVDRQMDG